MVDNCSLSALQAQMANIVRRAEDDEDDLLQGEFDALVQWQTENICAGSQSCKITAYERTDRVVPAGA